MTIFQLYVAQEINQQIKHIFNLMAELRGKEFALSILRQAQTEMQKIKYRPQSTFESKKRLKYYLSCLNDGARNTEEEIKSDPQSRQYFLRLGTIYYYIEDYKECLQMITSKISNHQDPNVYHLVADCLNKLRRFEEAHQNYNEALIICIHKGDYDLSFEILTKLASIEKRQRKFRQASKHLEQALSLALTKQLWVSPTIYCSLSENYQQIPDRSNAIKYYLKVKYLLEHEKDYTEEDDIVMTDFVSNFYTKENMLLNSREYIDGVFEQRLNSYNKMKRQITTQTFEVSVKKSNALFEVLKRTKESLDIIYSDPTRRDFYQGLMNYFSLRFFLGGEKVQLLSEGDDWLEKVRSNPNEYLPLIGIEIFEGQLPSLTTGLIRQRQLAVNRFKYATERQKIHLLRSNEALWQDFACQFLPKFLLRKEKGWQRDEKRLAEASDFLKIDRELISYIVFGQDRFTENQKYGYRFAFEMVAQGIAPGRCSSLNQSQVIHQMLQVAQAIAHFVAI